MIGDPDILMRTLIATREEVWEEAREIVLHGPREHECTSGLVAGVETQCPGCVLNRAARVLALVPELQAALDGWIREAVPDRRQADAVFMLAQELREANGER